MIGRIKPVVFWAPRITCLVFAGFISLFALDVFSEGYSPGETITALLIHLIPTFVLLLVLALAWKWEWVGAVSCAAAAAFYLGWSWGRFPLVTYLIICGPLLLTAGLFLINWIHRAELRAHQQAGSRGPG